MSGVAALFGFIMLVGWILRDFCSSVAIGITLNLGWGFVDESICGNSFYSFSSSAIIMFPDGLILLMRAIFSSLVFFLEGLNSEKPLSAVLLAFRSSAGSTGSSIQLKFCALSSLYCLTSSYAYLTSFLLISTRMLNISSFLISVLPNSALILPSFHSYTSRSFRFIWASQVFKIPLYSTPTLRTTMTGLPMRSIKGEAGCLFCFFTSSYLGSTVF